MTEPARIAIHAAIAQVAADLGVVLDANRPYEQRLIVYGAPENDLTPLVAEVLQAGAAEE